MVLVIRKRYVPKRVSLIKQWYPLFIFKQLKKTDMKERSYMAFLQEARPFIPQESIYTDELRRLGWGTDAGF